MFNSCGWTCTNTVVAAAIVILILSILVAVFVAALTVDRGVKSGRAQASNGRVAAASNPYRSLRISPQSQYDAVDSPLDDDAQQAGAAGSID